MGERHVLGVSGGMDSTALAIFMQTTHPEIPIEYFFCDTGKEPPETYEFLDQLESWLGRPIQRLYPKFGFDFWFQEYNYFLPSANARWCTRKLKVEPFELWIRPSLQSGTKVHNYIALRDDERERHIPAPSHNNLRTETPFLSHHVTLAEVKEILFASEFGFARYYDWRTQSGCSFCFFQRKIDWVGLKREHPELYEEARKYEVAAQEHGCSRTWSSGETLEKLGSPARIAKIKAGNTRKCLNRSLFSRREILRAEDFGDDDDPDLPCLICFK
jgi:hypothetical protein